MGRVVLDTPVAEEEAARTGGVADAGVDVLGVCGAGEENELRDAKEWRKCACSHAARLASTAALVRMSGASGLGGAV